MKIAWAVNPKVNPENKDTNGENIFLPFTKGETFDALLVSGHIASIEHFANLALQLKNMFPGKEILFNPTADCLPKGKHYQTLTVACNSIPACNLTVKGVVRTFDRVALFGAIGCEDPASIHVDEIPEERLGRNETKGVEDLDIRSINQARALTVLVRTAARDRNIAHHVIALGTNPHKEGFTYHDKDKENAVAPWFTSRALADFFAYRDTLRTVVPATVLLSMGEELREYRVGKNFHFINGGGYKKPGGNQYILEINEKGLQSFRRL